MNTTIKDNDSKKTEEREEKGAYNWNAEVIAVAKKVGESIRKNEADDLRNFRLDTK